MVRNTVSGNWRVQFKQQLRRLTLVGLATSLSFAPLGPLDRLCPVTSGLLRAADTDVRDWTQWRGPQRDGKLAAAQWPESLSEANLKLRWNVDLEPSYSGPLIVGDRVFVTETRDKKAEVVRALDRHTGETLWETTWEGALSVPFFAKANGDWIRSTPAYDDGRLLVGGMRDVLVCLDAETGKELWRVDFVQQLGAPVPDFGFVCSPLVEGNFIYVQAGGSLVKLDKTTGSILWRALEDGGGMFGSAFSSPVLETIAGVPQLLVQTRTKLAGVDPESGQVLWSKEIAAFRGMNILTPTVYKDGIFTSSYGGKSLMLQLSRNEAGQWSVEEKWTLKAEGYMSTPVVIDGHAYLHLKNQRFTCIDLETGESKWTTRPYGKYWSMIASGDRILALDANGSLHLVQANPEKFDWLGTVKVSEQETWAHLGIAGDQVFVRELKGLRVFEWK
jgi:outer membrane protein assembly factor BamB